MWDFEGSEDGSKTATARTRRRMAKNPGGRADRSRTQPAKGYRLSRALHRAGIHLDLPGHRTTRFRASGDRLRAGPMAAGIEVAQALRRKLPQPRRLPRGLHGDDRKANFRRDQAEVAADRRLLVSAR